MTPSPPRTLDRRLLGLAALLTALGAVYLVLVFLSQHYPNSVPSLATRTIGDEIEAFPQVAYAFWLVILFIVFNLYWSLRVLKRSFSYKEREPVQ